MWSTQIFLRKLDDSRKQEMLKALEDIKNKDKTFNYEVKGEILHVYSSDKNTAHRRGTWLINRIEPFKGLGYNVYWV